MLPQSLPETLCRQFSLSEIKSATDNFSTDLIIGKGSFGNVYKGTIVLVHGNTSTVAVKRRSFDSKQGLNEFWTEVKLLSRCRHSHLISLIGYCVDHDANEMILVYEYMSNGTLADHIYKKNDKCVSLSWEQRLRICISVCRGLDYLHTGTGINQIIIHRDLKSSNILLNDDWAAKISDFGLCKKCSGDRPYTPIIASLKGTYAYMDPTYLTTHELSTKTDVYAVGVVLLEVLCGRRSLDFEVVERQKRLVLWAEQCTREGVAHRIVDPGLRGSLTNEDLLWQKWWASWKLLLHYNLPPRIRLLLLWIAKSLHILTKLHVRALPQTQINTVETGSSRSDTMKQDPDSESTVIRRRIELKSSSETNALKVPASYLQSIQVKANVSIPTTYKTYIRLSDDKDDEYEKLFKRMNPLSVVIDNESCQNTTIIEVNGIKRQEVLLEVIQALTDIDFIFTRASMASDGLWSMNVFRVTDPEGNKVTDEKILDYIQKVLGSGTSFTDSIKSVGLPASADLTVIELIGSDRPGLLSEVCTVLLDLKCNIAKVNMWTHNTRAAFILLLTDEESGVAITDPMKLYNIKTRLCSVLTLSSNDDTGVNIAVTHGAIHTERRLHQMMFADYKRGSAVDLDKSRKPDVNVVNWHHKGCSVVTIRCPDRPKLLFDTICTLTDMDYIVLHGHAIAERTEAFQEYCIRHVDGSAVISDGQRQRVIECIRAAIERRVAKGLKLELCASDRIGLLSDVTRIFRENSLMITRADAETKGGNAVDTFYVRDASGNSVDSEIIDSLKQRIGHTIVKVKHNPLDLNQTPQESPSRFSFGGLFKFRYKRNLYNVGPWL